jgi:hypothetical protein
MAHHMQASRQSHTILAIQNLHVQMSSINVGAADIAHKQDPNYDGTER